MKQKGQQVEPQETVTGYEFREEDLKRSYWVWDRTHTPPGFPWAPMFSYWWFYGINGPAEAPWVEEILTRNGYVWEGRYYVKQEEYARRET